MVVRDSSILDYERHSDLDRFLTVVPAAPTLLDTARAPLHWNSGSPQQLAEPPEPSDLQGLEQQWRGRSTVTTDNPGAHAHHPDASAAHSATHDHIDDSQLAAAAPRTDVAGA